MPYSDQASRSSKVLESSGHRSLLELVRSPLRWILMRTANRASQYVVWNNNDSPRAKKKLKDMRGSRGGGGGVKGKGKFHKKVVNAIAAMFSSSDGKEDDKDHKADDDDDTAEQISNRNNDALTRQKK